MVAHGQDIKMLPGHQQVAKGSATDWLTCRSARTGDRRHPMSLDTCLGSGCLQNE